MLNDILFDSIYINKLNDRGNVQMYDYEAVYILMRQSQWIGNILHHILNLVLHIKCAKWTISTMIRLSKYDHYDFFP